MFWCVSFSIYPIWDSLGFLDSGGSFLSHCREVFKYILLKYFLVHFPFLFFFWNSYHLNAGVLKLSQRSLRLSSFIFILFFFFAHQFKYLLSTFTCFFFFIFILFYSFLLQLYPPFYPASLFSLTLSSLSVILLLVPLKYLLFQYCAVHCRLSVLYFILVLVKCLFYLLNLWLFSIYLCLHCISEIWIIFAIITMNYFSGRLSISFSFFSSDGFLLISIICCRFLSFYFISFTVSGVSFPQAARS